MEAKVHIRVDDLELDCEGSEEFLRQELPKILDAVVKSRQTTRTLGKLNPEKDPANAHLKHEQHALGVASTKAIATKIGGATGTKLLIAAAAKLSLIDNRETFSRDELRTEMKAAAGFYKATYSDNFSAYLSSLVKGKTLHEVSTDTYALPDTVRKELEEKLG